MKLHVQVDRRAARRFRRQMNIFDLLAPVIKVVAVDVEKRVEHGIEPLPRQDFRRDDAVLAVNRNLDVRPGVGGAVVDGEPVAFELKGFDLGLLGARATENRSNDQEARQRRPQRGADPNSLPRTLLLRAARDA